MNFAENLKQIRKENHLSQEELAELLDVSRQAVSKWEQGQGYPEVEKLLLLSRELHVSLDMLMAGETGQQPSSEKSSMNGTILIKSPHENVIVSCCKVSASQQMHGGKKAPKYALFGISPCSVYSFWGEPTTFLGWYADKENISKEVEAIYAALLRGDSTYTLQYSAKTRRRWASIKIIEE